MAIRRRFSFDLLRYDSSGDAEEDGEFINANLGIPTRSGSDAAVKSHGRRRRNKGFKKSNSDLLLFSAENGQIHGNNVARNSLNPLPSVLDIKCITEDTVEQSESGFLEQCEVGNGGISRHAEDSVLLFLADGNNNNTKKDEPVALDNQTEHEHTDAPLIFRKATDVDTNAYGVMSTDKVDSADADNRVSVCLRGADQISLRAEDYELLLLTDVNNNTKKYEPVALDNQIEHELTDDSLIFRKATDVVANADGVMGTDQVDPADPDDRVSVCLRGADRSVVVNTLSNLDDVSNICSNWGLSEHPSPPELRQRTVSVGLSLKTNSSTKCIVENELVEEEELKGAANPSGGSQQEQQSDKDSNKERVSFGDPQALDWERVMAHSSEYPTYVEMSPFQYFLGEINEGNSLRSTTSVGNDKKRQRVYNTMFHVPWRCELLIDVGFFVCLDSFLSLLTIMPAKILAFIWRCLKVRQFLRPCADELSDLGCLVILICGVALLQVTDISLIYHFIRGQGTVKLYVVFNVLEIFDKLCQSFGGDVLQVLFNSAEGVASSSKESMAFEIARFILDQMIAVVAFIAHSSVILAQAITLSAAIISHNNALLALLVSNNFAEIKSNVFKRVSEENLHKMAYYDTVERFHIMAYIIFVLAQNILEAENAWVWSFAMNACMIWFCEILVDVIKHAFLAKFNEIKPSAYSEFLETLCKQTLNSHSHEVHTTLTFIPLAPACVVIRVLTPIYAAHLPYGPFWWRWLWIILHFSVTYFLLATLKIIVGLGLQMHAKWYVYRCLTRKRHWHVD